MEKSDDSSLFNSEIDKVPPQIVCPPNVIAPAYSNKTTGTANWTEPIGTDNSLVANTTGTHSPPESFSIGTHDVTYTVVDPSGNTNNCTFYVTIAGMYCSLSMFPRVILKVLLTSYPL